MINWGYIFGRLFTTIASWLDSANLRNQLYQTREEHEVMWTGLDDIARMYKDTPAGAYAKSVLERITTRYGR